MAEKHYTLAQFPPWGLYFAEGLLDNKRVVPERPGPHPCVVCGRAASALRFGPPHYVELVDVKRFGDYLYVYGQTDFGISERFLGICEKEAVRGIEVVYPPIVVTRVGRRHREGRVPPVYHMVEIAREGADLDDEASGVVRTKILCPRCRFGGVDAYQRIVLKPESDRGLDIFCVLGLPGDFIVSEKFVDMCVRHQISNTYFTPCEVATWDAYAKIEQPPDPPGVVIPVNPRSARAQARAEGRTAVDRRRKG
ncbi:MAG: hypothetical protein PVJ57_06985 [Phycisphaerae bacterium]|jgi:hypothetical protein